jgi:hypothetical protein
MKLVVRQGDNFRIDFTADELGIIQAALNEVCNGIEVREFETRLGATLDEVRTLLSSVNSSWDA